MDRVITVELTVLELMMLRAQGAEMSTEDDVEAITAMYGREAGKLVEDNDVGFEVYMKLGYVLQEEGF